MKQIVIISTAIALTLNYQLVAAAPITDNYADGDPLTATTMNNIKAAVNDNDTNAGTNATAITTNATGITNNAAGITTNATGITNNATGITNNAAGITTNATGITTNATGITNNAAGITNNAAGITNNAAGITTNATGITTNATGITTNATGITTNTTGITTNATGITTNAAGITTNAAGITTNATNIGTNTGDIGTNTVNIGILDSQVTILEGKSPAIGRIVVPVVSVSGGTASISAASGILPDALSSTAYGGSFGVPTDYVSGEVTVKAIIGGCGGSSIAHSTGHPGLSQVNIGANTFGLVIFGCTSGTCPTVSIPANTGTFPFTTTFSVEVVSTFSSISDINTPSFTRFGADSGDTCSSNLTVHSFIIEYPRGN